MSLLECLRALVALDDLPRTGWVLRGVASPESIAGHVLGTAHVALALVPRVEPPLDVGRVLTLALVHDLPEAWSGDLPRPAQRHLPVGAKAAMEAGLAAEHLAPLGRDALEARAEYVAQGTREARFVRLCDRLQLGVRLFAYREGGQRGLEEMARGLEGLDASEFVPAQELLSEILLALRQLDA